MNKKVFISSIKISCSIIGSVIGAGFITGREIMSFFYGFNPFFTALFIFCAFFVYVFIILSVKNKKIVNLIEMSNYLVYALNLVIIASMLGATNSLICDLFSFSFKLPLFTIALLVVSTTLCLNGIGKINNLNLFLVPIMLAVLFSVITFLPKQNNLLLSTAVISPFKCIGYCSMNVLLAQPFLCKIKGGKEKFSPLLVSLTCAAVLAFCVFLYLLVLKSECVLNDIPLLLLVNKSKLILFLVGIIIFSAIFTTLISAQFPIINLTQKQNLKTAVVLISCVASFAISQLGFYVIVDKVYFALTNIAICYYAFFICALLISFVKRGLLGTSKRQEYIKSGCSSSLGRVLKPGRRKR